MNRRDFLQLMGATGGAGAVYRAMGAMGILPARAATTRAARIDGPTTRARDTQILILGAGLAGMGAAYELTKAGYHCSILEARLRPGGRCHTIRNRCVETELDGKSQTCAFADDIYFNAGPTRIPQDHLTLDYCRELGVAIEPFINVNDAAYFYAGGKRRRMRDAARVARSDFGEVIAKAVGPAALDKQMSRDEQRELLQLLRRFAFDDEDTRQIVMFQIVGGSDRLAKAFAERLGSDITYGAVVKEIRHSSDGVIVRYTDRLGLSTEARGDYCICTLPLPVLKSIPSDFAAPMREAIASIRSVAASKVGLQFKRRFWEEDDRIFGGITRTSDSITQIFYPSYGFLHARGLLVGCYNYGDQAVELGKLAPAARIERAVTEGARIHPQYRGEFECGFSACWECVPFSQGAWTGYEPGSQAKHFAALREPDGRIYLAGEHCSDMTGWMAGALQSARDVAEKIHRRVQA